MAGDTDTPKHTREPRRLRLRRLGGLLFCLLLALAVPAAPDADLERGLKVAYLYNFTRFVQWPEASLGADFVINVLGDPALATALRALERTQKDVQGRPIRVISDPERIGASQLLCIGAGAVDRLPALARAAAGRPVLLVGDSPELARRGVAINIFREPDILGEGERLRFEINPAALAGRELRVSAQLYDVAEIVR